MIRFFPHRNRGIRQSNGAWLPLLLFFVVLVPSVCLLWFVDRAADNEQLAVRQKLVDAYRANLLLAQERLQSYWLRVGSELADPAAREPAPALFARLVRGGLAEAAVCFDAAGGVAYPNDNRTATAEPLTTEWREARALEQIDPLRAAALYAHLAATAGTVHNAARALQAQARCLLRAGDRAGALAILLGPLAEGKYRGALDAQRRLIAPNAALIALELLPVDSAVDRRELIARIAARALDYDDVSMSSAQRRFLLRALTQTTAPGSVPPGVETFLEAEDLALRWLANLPKNPREAVLQSAELVDVRQFTLTGGRLVLLHRHAPLQARLQAAIAGDALPAGIRIDLVPPGTEPDGALLTHPAGAAMPEWRLALVPLDSRALAADTSARSASYLWIGGLTVLTVVVLALLTWELLRRQIALTRLRNDLVANVTHELKTPLSSMRLFVETLLATDRLDERTTREYLALIAQENLRLSRLIDNFLTFSRIERNKYTYAFRTVAAARIAEDAAAAVRERFQVPGCTFTTSIGADLPAVSADPDSLVTALINLLDNAWKYSGETKVIRLAVTAANGAVVFAVSDNGIGLSPRDAGRIFQRFYQVQQPRSPATGGCGLGLSIVHAIVTAHRGSIHVETRPGDGSTFTITLPPAPHTREKQ